MIISSLIRGLPFILQLSTPFHKECLVPSLIWCRGSRKEVRNVNDGQTTGNQ